MSWILEFGIRETVWLAAKIPFNILNFINLERNLFILPKNERNSLSWASSLPGIVSFVSFFERIVETHNLLSRLCDLYLTLLKIFDKKYVLSLSQVKDQYFSTIETKS